MFVLNGKQVLPADTPFVIGDVQYPANWLRLSSLEDKAALGIVEVVEQPRPDDRYYWVGSIAIDGTWSDVKPKDLNALKAGLITQTYSTCAALLAPTDHTIVRAVEVSTEPIYPATLTYRAAVRAASAAGVAAINACNDVETLAVVKINWPEVK